MTSFSPTLVNITEKLQSFSSAELFRLHLLMLLLASLSAVEHLIVILASRRLCGFGARTAYILLSFESLVGFIYSFSIISSSFLSAIGLKWRDCVIIWRVCHFLIT
ncbi:hypothetical protein DICVIV_11726 [Dictyocaulus viviparus]|uniref:7TM GPCR serpentine receptor class x (Srx) domain-containing protein n=1 Tax=Dictyocaulus viviparus TaxID=29172 RepID=A0A0D8XEX9_DICVI|nr:hypothetical protein DICVIV_11726 [Dictyocaulus viviparus]